MYEFEPKDIQQTWEMAHGLIFVGGFRHTPNVEGILWFAESVLPLLREKNFNEPIRVVGSGLDAKNEETLRKVGIEVLGKQDDLESIYRASRIAIIPLLSGRGKKGKLAEALSFGIPIITTEVGAESFGFQLNDGVEVANLPSDFASAILKVHGNQEIWLAMKKFGLSYCENNLSSKSVRESIREILT